MAKDRDRDKYRNISASVTTTKARDRVIPIPGEHHDSLLRCLAELVYLTQSRYNDVKSKLVHYYNTRTSTNDKPRPYTNTKMFDIRSDSWTPGLDDIPALSDIYGLDFVIVKNVNDESANNFEKDENGRPIRLHLDETEKRFQLVVSKRHSEIKGFCQSIVYKILYENVFEMANVDYAVNVLMNDRIALFKNNFGHREDTEKNYAPGEISLTGAKICAKRLINERILPFPYAAAKGLDENYNKNVPYDNWIESTDECDVKSFENDAIDVGDRCVCTLSNDCNMFSGYIQDIEYDKGMCTVFILRLGEMKKVNFQQIIPIFQHVKSFKSLQNKESMKQAGANSFFKPLEKFQYRQKYFKQRIFKKTQEYNRLYHHGQVIYNSNVNINDYEYDEKHTEFLKNDKFTPKIYHNDFSKNNDFKDILNEYTCVEMNYHNFQPCEMNIILHPLSVEHDSHVPVESNTNDTMINNRQNFSTPKPASAQTHVYPMGSTETPPVPGPYSSLPTTPLPFFPLVQQGNIPPQFASPSNYPPIMYVPTPFPYPRPLTTPPGINQMVQRSINLNGSDLPFHDIPTLRFFFNLGIDSFQASMMPTNSPRMITQVNVPISNYQQISPNQLAMEFQQGLTLDDSNQDINKNLLSPNNNNRNNVPRNRGNNENGNKFNRGGFHGRYKRNDISDKGTYRNGQNTNKPPSNNTINNNNNSRANTPRNIGKYNGNNARNNFSDGSSGKETPKDYSQPSSLDMLINNVQSPPIPYPPPPANVPPIHYQYYRYPYCPDGHSNIMSFPPPFQYNHIPSDDHSLPPPVLDNGGCFNPSLNMYPCTTASSTYCPPNNFTHSPADTNINK